MAVAEDLKAVPSLSGTVTLSALPPGIVRKLGAVYMREELGMGFADIGAEFGCSRQRAHRMYKDGVSMAASMAAVRARMDQLEAQVATLHGLAEAKLKALDQMPVESVFVHSTAKRLRLGGINTMRDVALMSRDDLNAMVGLDGVRGVAVRRTLANLGIDVPK
jgi:hypothetical protein